MHDFLSRWRALLFLAGLLLILGALVANPPAVGWLTSVDGRVDHELARRVLWLGSGGSLLLGLFSVTLGASDPARRALVAAVHGGVRLLRALWGWRRAGLAVGALVLLLLSPGIYRAVFPSWHHALDAERGAELAELRASVGIDAARGRLLEALAARWPVLPLDPVWLPAEVLTHQAERIQGGTLTGHVGGTMSWTPGSPVPFSDATGDVAFLLHRQHAVLDLVAAWEHQPEPAWLQTSAQLAAAWDARYGRLPTLLAVKPWNDDATSHRVHAWLGLLSAMQRAEAVDDAFAQRLLTSLVAHGDWLASEVHYNNRSNHGLMQDTALLALALALPELDRGARWRRTAHRRFAAYTARTLAEDGAFLELSPHYHAYVLRMCLWFVQAAARSGAPVAPEVSARVQAMAGFLTELVLPDGSLLQIGDTYAERLDPSHWPWSDLPAWPELAALRAQLEDGKVPYAPGLVSSPAGYNLVRWGHPDWTLAGAMVASLQTGPRSVAHLHPDKLSITLFAGGRRLLTGPGYPPFVDMPARLDAIHTRNQNTVSIDGKTQRYGAAETRFTTAAHRADGSLRYAVVGGRAELIDGLRHDRTLAVGPAPGAVLLIDDLSLAAPGDVLSTLRAGEGLTGAAQGGRVLLTTPDGERAITAEAWFARGDMLDAAPLRWEPPFIRLRASAEGEVRVVMRLLLGEDAGGTLETSAEGLRWASEGVELRFPEGDVPPLARMTSAE